MAARAEQLGDRGPSAPPSWEPGLGTGDAHVLVTVYAVDAEHLARRARRASSAPTPSTPSSSSTSSAPRRWPAAATTSASSTASPSPRSRAPASTPRPGDGQPDGAGGWRDVATGEVLLGYRDEDGTLPAAPGAPFERNGTFVVYRKLAMDVAAFRRYVAEQGERYPGGARPAGGQDRRPLARRHAARRSRPSSPDAAVSSDPQRINDFGYADDPDGLRCPLGAHIRRTNPRDAHGFFDGRLSNRHRIVRRGRAYGPPLAAGRAGGRRRRPRPVFVCFQADIWRQFETIQSLWVDDGDPFGLGRDKDFLIGEPHGTEGKMTIPGHPPFFLKPQPRFVTMRGGEYLFQPSMSALRRLAGET